MLYHKKPQINWFIIIFCRGWGLGEGLYNLAASNPVNFRACNKSSRNFVDIILQHFFFWESTSRMHTMRIPYLCVRSLHTLKILRRLHGLMESGYTLSHWTCVCVLTLNKTVLSILRIESSIESRWVKLNTLALNTKPVTRPLLCSTPWLTMDLVNYHMT